MKRFIKDKWIIFLLISIILVFYYKTITKGLYPIPSDSLVGLYHPFRDYYQDRFPRGMPFKNFLITDPVRQQIPWRHEVIRSWQQGSVPRFNPYSFSGADLIGNIQAAVFSPFNMLFFIFPFITAWSIQIIITQILAGVLFFLFIRNRGVSLVGSMIGSLAWAFSGFTVAWLTWGTIVSVSLWLPLGLLAVDKLRVIKKGSMKAIRWYAVLGFTWIMHIVSGHMQIAFYAIGFELSYFFYVINIRRNTFNIYHLISILVTGISALMISSAQLIPFISSFFASSRVSDVAGMAKAGWFVPYIHLVQFIAPDYFGNPTTLNYWGEWNYAEFVGYIGIVPIVFVMFSFANRKAMFRWIAALSILLVLILPTPIGKLSYIFHVPILSNMQPTRLMVLIDFILAVLASYGFDYFIREKWKNSRYIVLCIGIITGFLWVITCINVGSIFRSPEHAAVSQRNLIFPTILVTLSCMLIVFHSFYKSKGPKITGLFYGFILLIITIDLFRFGWKFIPFTSEQYFYPKTKSITYLMNLPKPYRIMSLDDRLLPSNVSAFYGIEDVGGYDPVYNWRYEKLLASINANTAYVKPPYGFNRILTVKNNTSHLLPIFNIGYVLSIDPIENDNYMKVFDEGLTKIYEYRKNLGRIWSVGGILSVSDGDGALAALFDQSFDPKLTAVVEHANPDFQIEAAETGIVYTGSPSHRFISITSSSNTFLVISEVYDPRWEIFIDRKSVAIYRTNYAFMGITLTKGKHTIEMVYR